MSKALPTGRNESSTYSEIFSRNIGAVTLDEQETLSKSNAIVLGCGGIGGIASEMLARAGVGELTVVDSDSFELSNLNRQLFSSFNNIGKKKAKEAERRIKRINPSIKFHSIVKKITEKNVSELIDGNQILVDGLDNALTRVIASRAAKDLSMHYVFGAAERTKGYSTVFTPHGISFEKLFSLPSNGKEINKMIVDRLANAQRCDAVLGVVANTIGCVEAMLSISVLLKKEFVTPPNLIHISTFDSIPLRVSPL